MISYCNIVTCNFYWLCPKEERDLLHEPMQIKMSGKFWRTQRCHLFNSLQDVWNKVYWWDRSAFLWPEEPTPKRCEKQKEDKWLLCTPGQKRRTWVGLGKCVIYWQREVLERKKGEGIIVHQCAQNPSKVVDAKVILNLEKGLELDPMWGFFNKQFRRTMEKKIPGSVKLWLAFSFVVSSFWVFQDSVGIRFCMCTW